MKLRDLKRRIEGRQKESREWGGGSASGADLPSVECCRDYETPEQFAEMLNKDLIKAIDRDYQATAYRPKTATDAEFIVHVAYAKPLVQVYEGAKHVYRRIEAYTAKGSTAAGEVADPIDETSDEEDGGAEAEGGDGPAAAGGGEGEPGELRTPLVLLGSAGSGKSAAVANWFLRNNRPGFVLVHFVGCSANSTDHILLVRRLLTELQRAFRLEGDVPDVPKQALELLPLWLDRACAFSSVVILIDGIEHLVGEEAASLKWLPNRVPPNCSIVLTASTGSAAAKSVERRGWNRTVAMDRLSVDEKKRVVITYLDLFHKRLEGPVLELICNAEQTGNPLFLRMLVDELVTTAVFETVMPITTQCLTAKKPLQLCDFVLQRLETDFGAELVSKAFSYIEASRFGLSEEELLAVLDVPPDAWSPFYLATRASMCVCGGLFNISSSVLRRAVQKRYFKNEAAKKLTHHELRVFFEHTHASRPDLISAERCANEIPYQLLHAHEFAALERFLLDIGQFVKMEATRRYDLFHFWRARGKELSGGNDELPANLGDVYLKAADKYAKTLREQTGREFEDYDARREQAVQEATSLLYTKLGTFLTECVHLDAACTLLQRAQKMDHTMYNNESRRVAEANTRLARCKQAQGKEEEAVQMFYLSYGIYRQLAKPDHPQHEAQAEVLGAKTLIHIAEIVSRGAGGAAQARSLMGAALRSLRKSLGPRHPECAILLNALSSVCFELSKSAPPKVHLLTYLTYQCIPT